VSDLPERKREESAPGRRLTSDEFELVIRRAAELQAGSADETSPEGVSEEEALRIGRELGLTGEHLVRALAEVRGGGTAEETGVAARLFGGARIRAARALRGNAAALGRTLEAYLTEHEFLVVQRRLADRTLYVRASGVVAAVARTTSGIFRRAPLLELENLEVSVRQVEPETAYVGVGTDVSGERTGYLVGAGMIGGVGGGMAALVLSIAIAPPAALVALPIAAAGLGGMRYAYQESARKAQVQLEALLDRLEHGELKGRR
jgi:hypothetical protein